jgi:hypothetical protein
MIIGQENSEEKEKENKYTIRNALLLKLFSVDNDGKVDRCDYL